MTMEVKATIVDLHSHLLPSLDDGPHSFEQSLQLAQQAWEDGTTTIACTPHCAEGTCPSQERLDESFAMLSKALPAAGLPDLHLISGAELMISPSLASFLERHPYLTYGGLGRYCLVELPLVDYPLYTGRVLFDLLVSGIQPILAHPERNARLQREPHLVRQFAERGILLQANAGSFLGHYGRMAERSAYEYLRRGWLSMIASDGHNGNSRPPLLSHALKAVGWTTPTPGLPHPFP
ncbi:MAG: phosphotransferase [Coprothermobacterota bacterium]|nr:phosphotransferase [Coprothermobacterota bacterium]